MYDYSGLIKDVVLPGIEDARFYKPWDEFAANFTEDNENPGGPTWRHTIKTSSTSTARNFTKADVDPQAGSFVSAEAYWNFIYQEAAAEVHEIDINQAKGRGMMAVEKLFTDAFEDAMNDLWALIFDDVYAQIKLDLTAAGTYSDAALNRSTYPVLAPYNELTNTTITVPLVRNMQYNTQLNKTATGGNKAYTIMMEPAVLHAFRPQAALLHTWNETSEKAGYSAGYAPVADFEGSKVTSPGGMTIGDVFFIRKPDVQIKKHMDLNVKEVTNTGRFSIKSIIRCGVNARVINVGKQGMMTNKD